MEMDVGKRGLGMRKCLRDLKRGGRLGREEECSKVGAFYCPMHHATAWTTLTGPQKVFMSQRAMSLHSVIILTSRRELDHLTT